MNTKALTLSVCAVTIGLTGLLSSCGKKESAPMGAASAPQLSVITVEPTDAEFQSSFPATLKGKTDIDIRPQVTGFITAVHVDEGQRVHRGQPLFTIDQVQFQAAVDQAEANLNSARSAVSTAEITEQNKRHLLDRNIISQSEWQLAANQLAQARAAQAQAEAALVQARKNLSYTVVTAPHDGVVGVIPNREGSLASPSSVQPLTTISDNSEVYAYFSLTERDILELTQDGQTSIEAAIAAMPQVQLQLADGSIYPISGRVATLSGVIDNSTGAASARALFENPGGRLRSGNTAQVLMPRTTAGALTIPQRATYELQDLRYVYVLNDSNITESRQITVSPFSDGQTFVVTSGLNPGDRVVTEGIGTIVRAGMPVQPKTAE